MKFKFQISKLANQFFFVSNLSEWHFSCRPSYNKIWLEKTGVLLAQEKKALDEFKNIISSYGFTFKNGGSQYLGRFFYLYPDNQSWRKLKNFVGEKKFEKIREIFDIFEPRFQKIWRQYYKRDRRIKIIADALKQKKYKMLFEDIERIFSDKKIRTMNLVIIISPLEQGETASGSATIGGSHIILELPALKSDAWQFDYSIGILAHEIGHILFENSGGLNLISKVMKQLNLPRQIKNLKIGALSVINEAITASFVPIGYLGQKYSDFRLSPMLLNNLDKGFLAYQNLQKNQETSYYHQLQYYLIWKLYPLAVIYGRQRKKIDKDYIYQAGRLLKDII